MTDDMVERVARAIFEAREEDEYIPGYRLSWGEGIGNKHDAARVIARAAIQAMREPTEKMFDAGTDACNICCKDGGSANIIWEVMIDAALKSGER